MKNLQEKYISYLNETKAILDGINFETTKQGELLQNIKNVELLVPIVGGFSAGKSTLLNNFLGENILATNLTPETALATELRYSADSHFEAVNNSGELQRFELNEADKIKQNAHNFQFVRLFLNNRKLKDISPLVLVDMPGFDAPIELHNKAILNYLSKGKHFIILISSEDGNITKSIFRELENINEFSKGFDFCLSKTDLKPQSDIDAIKNRIAEQLNDEMGYRKQIFTSRLNDDGALWQILRNIDAKELFKNIFLDELKGLNFQTQSAIKTSIHTLKTDTQEAQRAINELEDAIRKIENTKQNAIDEIQSKYSNSSVNVIIRAIMNKLDQNANNLINLLVSNGNGFSDEINSIIKAELIKQTNIRMSEITQNVVSSFAVELNNISLQGFEIDEHWIQRLSDNANNLITKAQQGLIALNESLKKGDGGKIYKAITAVIGITTTVINPVLEVIIVFLPEIISFFSKGYQEKKRLEQARDKFFNDVIPSIKTKLGGELPAVFSEQINSIIEIVSQKFESSLAEKRAQIEQAGKEKSQNIEKNEARINQLDDANKAIQNLATKYLY